MSSWGIAGRDHSPSIVATGWGEPATFHVRCSCGWSGLTVHERCHPGDDVAELTALSPGYAAFATTYGLDALLPADGVYGTRDEAVIQAMVHVGYDPAVDLDTSIADLAAATAAVTAAADGQTPGHTLRRLRSTLRLAADELGHAADRNRIWATTRPPTRRPADPAAAAALAELHRSRKTGAAAEGAHRDVAATVHRTRPNQEAPASSQGDGTS